MELLSEVKNLFLQIDHLAGADLGQRHLALSHLQLPPQRGLAKPSPPILRHRRQPTDGKAEWPFDAPFDLILNLAIGGDWASQKGIDDAAMPQRMEVDYVRVWQAR